MALELSPVKTTGSRLLPISAVFLLIVILIGGRWALVIVLHGWRFGSRASLGTAERDALDGYGRLGTRSPDSGALWRARFAYGRSRHRRPRADDRNDVWSHCRIQGRQLGSRYDAYRRSILRPA